MEASVATTSGTAAPVAAPSGTDEQCPPWAMELRGQLDVLQQSTVLAQQEARAAREDSRRSDMLLSELQRRVDGLRHVPANGGLGASLGATSGLAAGLVGSLWGATKGVAGGSAALGAPSELGDASTSTSASAAASASVGDSMAIGGLHAMMDAHFKQMEELWQEVAGMRETTDARLKEVTLALTPNWNPNPKLALTRGSRVWRAVEAAQHACMRTACMRTACMRTASAQVRREQMTQHKKLSARLGALEAPRSSTRVSTEAEAEAETTEVGGAAGDAAAGAAAGAAAAAAADLAAAENREHFEEVRSCIEALTMQVAKPYPTLHPIHRSSLSHPTDRLHPSTQLTPI